MTFFAALVTLKKITELHLQPMFLESNALQIKVTAKVMKV